MAFIGVVAFIAALLISVMIHEAGRGAKVGAGADGIPKSTMAKSYLEIKSDWIKDVCREQKK